MSVSNPRPVDGITVSSQLGDVSSGSVKLRNTIQRDFPVGGSGGKYLLLRAQLTPF